MTNNASDRAHPRPFRHPLFLMAAGLFAVIAVVLVALVCLTQSVMTAIRDGILKDFEKNVGYEISYDTLSPSFFRFMEIRDLKITSLDSEKRLVAAAEKLRLHYNFFELLFVADKMRALHRIELERGSLTVDKEKERRLIAFLEGLLKNPANEYRLPPDFSLAANNLTLSYGDGKIRLSLENLFATAKMENALLRFTLHARGQAGRSEYAKPEVFTGLDMAGKVDTSLAYLDAEFRVESFTAGQVVLKDQQFHISLKEKTVEVTKVQDRSPLDLSLQYSFADQALDVVFRAEDLKPERLIAFEEGLAGLRPALQATFSADGALRYEVDRNDLDFTLALDGHLPKGVSPVAVRLHSRVTGTEEQVDFHPVIISSDIGRIEFAGNVVYQTFFPEGFLRLVGVKTNLGKEINADLEVARTASSVTLKGERILLGTAGFRSFLLDIFPRPGYADFVVAAALDVPLREHHIKVQGTFDYQREYKLALNGELASLPTSFFYKALAGEAEAEPFLEASLTPLLWSADFSLTTDFRNFSLTAPVVSLRDNNHPRNAIAFNLAADENELTISQLKGIWADYDLSGNVSLSWETNGATAFLSDFYVNREKYSLSGRYLPGAGLMASGDYGLALLAVPQKNGGYYFALQSAGLPLPLPGKTLRLTLDWIGFFSPERGLELVSRKTNLTDLPQLLPGMRNPSVDARFSYADNQVTVSELVYRDAVSALKGNGNVLFDFSQEARASGWFYLADENRLENYLALLDVSPTRGSLDLRFENSPLAHWGDTIVRGGISGELRLRGPFADPTIDMNFALKNGRLNSESLALQADFTYSREGVTLKSLEGAYGKKYKLRSGRGDFSTKTGFLDFQALFSAGSQDAVTADIALQVEARDFQENEPLAGVLNKIVEGRLTVVNTTVVNTTPAGASNEGRNVGPDRWELRFKLENGQFYLGGGPEETIYGLVRQDGHFQFNFSPPFPLQGSFEGNVKDNLIDARAENVVVLLPALNELIDSPLFVIREGTARGDLTVTGPVGDPDFFGLLTVDDFTASSSVFADTVGPMRTLLEAKEKNLRLLPVSTRAGAAPLTLGAEMIIDHWNISQLKAQLAVTDSLGVHVKLPVDVFSFDGFVTTPNLILTSNEAGFKVEGSLFVQKCDIVAGEAQKTEEPSDGDDANLKVDLSLKTGKQVEFYWPNKNLPILHVLTEPGATISIKYPPQQIQEQIPDPKVNKLAQEFVLTGDIRFKGGNVYYFDRNFIIREGSLSLKETALDFNPLFSLKAERRFRYNDKDVKIIMGVTNQHLKNFEPVFDSDPLLPITERYLALGIPIWNPDDPKSEENIASLGIDVGGDVLTQLVLLRPLEDKVKELLNLDGFSIRTKFIGNLLSTFIPAETEEPENQAINMGRYLNNTEIVFQKYLDERSNLYFETVLRVQSDVIQATSQSFGNVNLESEFSIELTTPFFLTIKWSITPEHWEAFFLPDNKITFKWGISF